MDWRRLAGRLGGATILALAALAIVWTAYLQPSAPQTHAPVMGIVSMPAEDERRETQTVLLRQAAEADGFEVLLMPVERTQEAQIEAIRALIVYQVDVIVFTPIVERGWDHVVREAGAAGVPLIAVDRSVRKSEESVNYIGFDYAALAKQTMHAMLRQEPPRDGILELYDTLGASNAREIARGCREALVPAGLEIAYSLCGDGMRSRGFEILEGMEENLDEIGCIVAHNDAMARGAVDYLRAHGRVPGRDVLVCSFGGGADVRALLEEGAVQVVAALDDAALAELTIEAAREIVETPGTRICRFAQAEVLEGGGA